MNLSNPYQPFMISYWKVILISILAILTSCTPEIKTWETTDSEGTFLIYRRQSLIGEENYQVSFNEETIRIESLQGENERGRISGVQAELILDKNLNPQTYINQRIANNDTTNIFQMTSNGDEISILEKHFEKVTFPKPNEYFPLHSNIPAAIEMMLYHYYFKQVKNGELPTLPRGEISITYTGQDNIIIKEKNITLYRYVVEGINWGGRTVWLDENKNLIALVKANTQIREIIKKGYEEAMPVFIAGNVQEQMNALSKYTEDLKGEQQDITALVGGNVLVGTGKELIKDATILIEKGRITSIGETSKITIPEEAHVLDVAGKTLIPGLWDMHAHSNQVQWAPAYLAGGVTTIRDNGNEIEFATAFRDAIDVDGALGPDILLAGMTDGPGAKGNGAIRARTIEEAKEVVAMYHSKGYRQIKIYNSIEPNILKVLSTEAHNRGMTVTGHVPVAVGNAANAIESGMDQLSHSGLFMTVLMPGKTTTELGRNFLNETEITPNQINTAIDFLRRNETVLDPTIALSVVRAMPRGLLIETIEPDAGRIAYELWEGKRFRRGLSPERSAQAIQGNKRTMEIIGDFHRAGIPIVAGTDNVVPVFSLYLELESYCKLGGLSPLEAIQTATIIPARAMGMDEETGTIEIGKEADIAILDLNPLDHIENIRTVSAVMTNGNYYKSDPLWSAADFKTER